MTVQRSESDNALKLGDDDVIQLGDYELSYSSTDDQWQATYKHPVGGKSGHHGEIRNVEYVGDRVQFDGDGHIESRTAPQFDTEVTATARVKVDTINDGFVFSSHSIKDNDAMSIWFDEVNECWATGVYTTSGTGKIDNTGNTRSTGEFYDVTSRYDGSSVTLYVNGTEVASVSHSGSVIGIENLIVGARHDLTDRFLIGEVDNLQFHNRALTASEISTLHDGGSVSDGLVLNYEFNYDETPDVAIDSTGDVYPKGDVPVGTSGSLFPTDYADALAGKALADDGNLYDSVQNAVDAATGYVIVGPGTFNESVSIGTAGLTLQGSGQGTLIDGGTNGHAVHIQANNVTVENLSVRTEPSTDDMRAGVVTDSSYSNATISNIKVRESDAEGVKVQSPNSTVDGCVALNSSGVATIYIMSGAVNCVARNCHVSNDGNNGIRVTGDDSVIIGCYIENTATDGIVINSGNDCVIGGNRIHNAGDSGINMYSGTQNIIFNNRVSDSTNSDIADSGTSTTLDDNLTGTAN